MLTAEAPSARTTVRRRAQRGRYEREVVHAILDEALVCHVGFESEHGPVVLPTMHARVEDTLYLHGAVGNAMLRALAAGAPVCVTVTLLDGLVLARSAFHHSMNYRSVVVFGAATAVEDRDAKLAALEALIERIHPGRWTEARQPTDAELRQTLVVSHPARRGLGQGAQRPADRRRRGLRPRRVGGRDPARDPQAGGGSRPDRSRGGCVRWLTAEGSWLSRLLLQRALAGGLSGRLPRGPQPVPRAPRRAGAAPRCRATCASCRSGAPPACSTGGTPTGCSAVVAWTGIVVAAACVVGLPERGPLAVSMLAWALLWVLYLSIVNVGQVWYGFGWESLLLEAGFLAVFLGSDATPPRPSLDPLGVPVAAVPARVRRRAHQAARRPVLAGPHLPAVPPRDPAHAEPAQPAVPPPAAVAAPASRCWPTTGPSSSCPGSCSRPQPVAAGAAVVVLVTQGWLVLSGNFSWLNVLTMTLGVAPPSTSSGSPPELAAPGWHQARRRRGRRGRRRPELVAGAQHGRPARPGHERQLQPAAPRQHLRRLRQRHQGAPRDRHRGRGVAGTRRRPGGSTSSRASRATSAAARPRSRRTTCASTGSCGSRRCRPRYGDAWFGPLLQKLLEGDAADAATAARATRSPTRRRRWCGLGSTATGSRPAPSGRRPARSGRAR